MLHRSLPFCLALAFVLAGPARATLLGDHVEIGRFWGNTGFEGAVVVAGNGIEYDCVLGLCRIDVDASAIRLLGTSPPGTSLTSIPGNEFRISDLDWVGWPGSVITQVSVAITGSIEAVLTGIPPFGAGNVSFSDREVRIAVGGYVFRQGSVVEISLIPSHLPEPTRIALLVLAGAAGVRRIRTARP